MRERVIHARILRGSNQAALHPGTTSAVLRSAVALILVLIPDTWQWLHTPYLETYPSLCWPKAPRVTWYLGKNAHKNIFRYRLASRKYQAISETQAILSYSTGSTFFSSDANFSNIGACAGVGTNSSNYKYRNHLPSLWTTGWS